MMRNDVPHASPEQENAGKNGKIQKLLKRVWNGLVHNWGWKAASLALAVCLWGALISQDTSLPRDKVIEDVRVMVINTATLRSNGLVVVSGLDDIDTVTIRASVPQKNYTSASSANYTARLDLSQIQTAGEQTVKLTALSSNATQYGTVKEVMDPDVTIVVEELHSLTGIPVEVRREGALGEGYWAGALEKSVDYVDITGPASVVGQVSRCVVSFDQSTLNPERTPNTFSLPFFFEDAEGNALDGSRLTVTPRGQNVTIQRISVSQEVYYQARVQVASEALIKGAPAEGYAVSGVKVSPQYITIAGSQAVIAPYLEEDAAVYPYDQVDITGQTRTVSQLLYLNTPGNVEYISNNAIQVVVTILPEVFVNVDSAGAAVEQNP